MPRTETDRISACEDRPPFKRWLEDGGEEPFVLERDGGCGECDALFPTRLSLVALWFRYAYMALVNMMIIPQLKPFMLRLIGAKVGKDVFISPWVKFDPVYPSLITIEDGALLGLGCRILTHEYTADRVRVGRVHIGRGAVVGAWSTVRSGVRIGERATVGCNSFVNRDVADGATVGGVPARMIYDGAGGGGQA